MAAGGGVSFLQVCSPWKATRAPVDEPINVHTESALNDLSSL